MPLIDLVAFDNTPLVTEPFEYCIVPHFIKPDALERIHGDYPDIKQGGSFPVEQLTFGASFQALTHELLGTAMRAAFAKKFNLELAHRPATLTVRGHCRAKDGKIHVDSKTKLITVLIYLNGPWEHRGGRLRLLHDGQHLDNYFAEVPPEQGTLLCFRNGSNAWHGHQSFSGPRRVLQLNWVIDDAAARASIRRHSLSAWIKQKFSLRLAG
jgi:SM-20-related protein